MLLSVYLALSFTLSLSLSFSLTPTVALPRRLSGRGGEHPRSRMNSAHTVFADLVDTHAHACAYYRTHASSAVVVVFPPCAARVWCTHGHRGVVSYTRARSRSLTLAHTTTTMATGAHNELAAPHARHTRPPLYACTAHVLYVCVDKQRARRRRESLARGAPGHREQENAAAAAAYRSLVPYNIASSLSHCRSAPSHARGCARTHGYGQRWRRIFCLSVSLSRATVAAVLGGKKKRTRRRALVLYSPAGDTRRGSSAISWCNNVLGLVAPAAPPAAATIARTFFFFSAGGGPSSLISYCCSVLYRPFYL